MRRRLIPLVLLAALGIPAAPAQADDASTLTVVGTSDVSDSNLIQSVIKPGFEAAYPQYKLSYVSKGTGAAIAYAEAGTASALLVHAASLENQFVDAGYSTEKYGRAIFYGDYVLVGPDSDPAGVLTNAPHDIVGAFQRIASAGAGGTANFVSRGGTPGTTVQEHAIWNLTTGSTLCAVSTTNGGGSSPSTTSGDCPKDISYPSWYHATGLTQGPNIVNGDTCNYSGGGCYVFTDRGTFNYLQSTKAISHLRIVTRTNDPAATGGGNLLVNSFHAYGVNPAAFSSDVASQINTTAAAAFLTWITSPAAQTAVGNYLNDSNDAPFLPDAAPALTGTDVPTSAQAGKTVTVTGTLRNIAPGTPPLAAKTVNLVGTGARAAATVLGTATTGADGTFSITAAPSLSGAYSLQSPPLSQVEDATLSPVFGDLLANGATGVGSLNLTATVATPRLRTGADGVSVAAAVAPGPLSARGIVRAYAAKAGQAFRPFSVSYVGIGSTRYTGTLHLPRGTWNVKVVFQSQDGQFLSGTSPTAAVRVR